MPMSNLGKRFNPFTAVKNYMEQLNYRALEKRPEGPPTIPESSREKFRNVMRFFEAYYRIFAGNLLPKNDDLKDFDHRHAGIVDGLSGGFLYNLEYAATRVVMKAETEGGKTAAFLLLKGPLNLIRMVGGGALALAFAIPSLFIYGIYKACQAAKAKRLYRKFNRALPPVEAQPEVQLLPLAAIKTDKNRLDYTKLSTQNPGFYLEITKKGKGENASFFGAERKLDGKEDWNKYSKVVMTNSAREKHLLSEDESSGKIQAAKAFEKQKVHSNKSARVVFRERGKTQGERDAEYAQHDACVQTIAYIPR